MRLLGLSLVLPGWSTVNGSGGLRHSNWIVSFTEHCELVSMLMLQ